MILWEIFRCLSFIWALKMWKATGEPVNVCVRVRGVVLVRYGMAWY